MNVFMILNQTYHILNSLVLCYTCGKALLMSSTLVSDEKWRFSPIAPCIRLRSYTLDSQVVTTSIWKALGGFTFNE